MWFKLICWVKTVFIFLVLFDHLESRLVWLRSKIWIEYRQLLNSVRLLYLHNLCVYNLWFLWMLIVVFVSFVKYKLCIDNFPVWTHYTWTISSLRSENNCVLRKFGQLSTFCQQQDLNPQHQDYLTGTLDYSAHHVQHIKALMLHLKDREVIISH